MKILNGISTLLIIGILANATSVKIVAGGKSCQDDPDDEAKEKDNEIDDTLEILEDYIPEILLVIFGIAIFLIAKKTIKRLEKYFPKFYLQNKKILMIPALGLSLPMLCRGFFGLLCNIDAIDDWTDDHILFFIPFMFFVGELIPNCF